jgi:hypothetical protein
MLVRLTIVFISLAGLILPQSAAAAPIPCSDIPAAERFVEGLRPGPNTEQARRHLEAAKRATADVDCDRELRLVDKYARRSAAADQRAAKPAGAPPPAGPAKEAPARRVECADWLHQDRPGGSDYHGPPVPGCPRR